MNRHTSIKIPLPGSHFDRDAKPLHHLRAPKPQNMQANNILLRPLAHDLVLGWLNLLLFCWVEVIKHGCEACVVDFHSFFPILRNGLRFRETGCANLWMREYHSRNVGVVQFCISEVRSSCWMVGAEKTI